MSRTSKRSGLRAAFGIALAGLAVACGGSGGGGGGAAAIPLSTNVYAGWTGTYLAKFDVTGEALTPANTLVPVTGTLEFADQPGTKASPTSLLTGVIRRVTWTLTIGGSPGVIADDVYLYVDGLGNWFEQGSEAASGIIACTTPVWWHGSMPGATPLSIVGSRLFLHGPTEAAGDSIWVAPTPQADDCFFSDVGSAAWQRDVVGTENVATPFGTFECYRAEEQLLRNSDLGFERTTITRWERPELGLVAMDRVYEQTGIGGRERLETHAKLVSHTP